MPKYSCSYAYSVSCFADFTVEAETEAEAEKLIKTALAEGKFQNVECDVNWDNIDDHRVFVSGEATDFSPSTTLEDLLCCHDPAPIAS